MLEGSAGGFAMILEDENIAEALVVFQVEHAVAIRPQNIFDGARRKRGERGHVVGRFDDYFVGADAVHFVEEAFAFAIEIAFNAESGEPVGNDTDIPAGRVGAAAVAAVDENFGRRLAFGAGTEGAILGAGYEDAFTEKIGRALSAIGGDNDPASCDGIFTQLRQSKPPRIQFAREKVLGTVLCLELYRAGAAFYSCGLKASLWRRTAGRGRVVVDGHDVEAAGV